jgi:drug/metabolite transporter superfamily protein YnfA
MAETIGRSFVNLGAIIILQQVLFVFVVQGFSYATYDEYRVTIPMIAITNTDY